MNEEKLQDSLDGLASELAFIGEKLNEISKCLKKMSNWNPEDEEKFEDLDSDEEVDEDDEDADDGEE
jgi:hypothetical protein